MELPREAQLAVRRPLLVPLLLLAPRLLPVQEQLLQELLLSLPLGQGLQPQLPGCSSV